MLIELADERRTPLFSGAPAAKICFTPVCVSSKFPRTAQTQTFAPSCVTICAFCTAETPASG